MRKNLRKRLLRGCCILFSLVFVLLSMFSFAACGEDELPTVPEDELSSYDAPNGAPLRAVYPISEVRLSFPGGNGIVQYSYVPESRTVTRETTLSETAAIPGITPASYHTKETYLFNSDGLPESYLLEELFETAVDTGVAVAAEPAAESADEQSASSEQPEGNDDGAKAGISLFRRGFFYEKGMLTAVTEEDLTVDGAAVRKQFLRGDDGFLHGAVISPLLPDAIEDASSAVSGDASSALTSDLSSDAVVPDWQETVLAKESYEIGQGGLPMYIYGPAPGEVWQSVYTISGRTIVGRQLRCTLDGQALWNAQFTYAYNNAGRVARVDWVIRREGDATSEASSDAASGNAAEELFLPTEGGYSMTINYADDVPVYLAAACEELRIGSLEYGYSADREMRLLAPTAKAPEAQE